MRRALNIALRTMHVGAMAMVVGGSATDAAEPRVRASLWLAVGTGLALSAIESDLRLTWLHELRGLLNVAKVALLCTVAFVPGQRLLILLAVLAIGSVASHMPRRFRHYSVLYRRVIDAHPGV
jgi:hypothetical protein